MKSDQGESAPVSLTSRWYIRPGREAEVVAAVTELAARVRATEPGTLMYLVHTVSPEPTLQSLPPPSPQLLLFMERYRDAAAFQAHVSGPAFTAFVATWGDAFVPDAHGRPYTEVTFLREEAGFVRDAALAADANQHPAVMFEVIARDQTAALDFYTRVFGWQYRRGTGGFAYIPFPDEGQPLLGGIGQSTDAPGFAPGCAFYLQVTSVEATLQAALAAGATPLLPPTRVDGYRFAMFRDPEQNAVGLIEPFSAPAAAPHAGENS